MEQLWKIRRRCINIAEEFTFLLFPLLKFLVAYLAFSAINKQLGYMSRLDNTFIVLALALISAVLPNMVMIMLGALLLVAQSFGVHLFAGVFVVLLLLLLYIFLQRFSEKYSLLLVITPLAVQFGLMPIVAVAGGLLLGPAALLPICSGTLVYAVASTVIECAPVIHGVGVKEFTTVITQLLDSIMAKTDTILLLIITASVFLIVYALRRLSVAYAWQIALVCGALSYLVLVMVGGFFMDTSMTAGGALLGILAAVAAGEVIIFFRCGLEYKRTQRLQFEDDDYYYYVKAVPKVDGEALSAEKEEPEPDAPVRKSAVQPEMAEQIKPRPRKTQIDDLESELEKAMKQIQE